MYDTLPNGQGLLAPLGPACLAGSDLRSNDLFLQARDVRNAARDSERLRAQGNACDNTRLLAQWQQVATQCCDILKSHSKDLDVCAWLIEAWARLHGTRGIAAGFMLYREFLTNYWDEMPPSSDEDMAARVFALTALNGSNRIGTLVEAVNYFNVTTSDAAADFTLWQYCAATEAQRITDEEKRQQRLASLGFSLQQIQLAADATTDTSYQAMLADCDAAQQALRQLDEALAHRLGGNAPNTTQIHHVLEVLCDALTYLGGPRTPSMLVDTARSHPQVAPEMKNHRPSQSTAAPSTSLQHRQDAIAQLNDVGRYFRDTEPHSPLASAIERLVRWAGMSCEELMLELIPDHNARDALWLMTGIMEQQKTLPADC